VLTGWYLSSPSKVVSCPEAEASIKNAGSKCAPESNWATSSVLVAVEQLSSFLASVMSLPSKPAIALLSRACLIVTLELPDTRGRTVIFFALATKTCRCVRCFAIAVLNFSTVWPCVSSLGPGW
jgi:hypothetical protein